MTKHHIAPWIAACLLLLSITLNACAELSLPSAEGIACGNSSECAGLVCDPVTMTCQKPLEDTDTGISDTGNNIPGDTGSNPANNNPGTDAGNNNPGTDTGNNPPATYSGCTDDTQCAGYQTCNVARGRCEDARNACTSNDTCETGEQCNAGVCTNTCNETTDCAQGLECLDTGTIKLCITVCSDFSPTSTDCAPDSHCIPYFGSDGGVCQGTGRKTHGENCLANGDPDGCRPGYTCLTLGKQRTCQKLCADALDTPSCSADTYCEPAFYGSDNDASTDDAGVCLNDCNTDGQPDNSKCPAEYTCLTSTDTNKAFCIADDGG